MWSGPHTIQLPTNQAYNIRNGGMRKLSIEPTKLYWGVQCRICRRWIGLALLLNDPINAQILLPIVLPNTFQADCPEGVEAAERTHREVKHRHVLPPSGRDGGAHRLVQNARFRSNSETASLRVLQFVLTVAGRNSNPPGRAADVAEPLFLPRLVDSPAAVARNVVYLGLS